MKYKYLNFQYLSLYLHVLLYNWANIQSGCFSNVSVLWLFFTVLIGKLTYQVIFLDYFENWFILLKNYIYLFMFFILGSLRFGKVDVTEAQFTIIFIHLVSAIFGPSFWTKEVVCFLYTFIYFNSIAFFFY